MRASVKLLSAIALAAPLSLSLGIVGAATAPGTPDPSAAPKIPTSIITASKFTASTLFSPVTLTVKTQAGQDRCQKSDAQFAITNDAPGPQKVTFSDAPEIRIRSEHTLFRCGFPMGTYVYGLAGNSKAVLTVTVTS